MGRNFGERGLPLHPRDIIDEGQGGPTTTHDCPTVEIHEGVEMAASRWTKSSIRAASIIARAESQLHGATVARLQTLTPSPGCITQKEAGVLGKVEQREGAGSVEESFLFGPRNFHPFHFSFQPSLPPARLHSTLLYESLSLRFIRLSIHPSPPLSLPTRPDHSLAHVFGLRYHVSCRSRSIARTVFHVYNGTFVILVNQPSADLGQILAQAVYKGCPKIYAGFELNIKESLWIFIFYA